MDLFVDAIDSKLLPSEKYRKLLKSKKKRKTSHGVQSDDKNKYEKTEESNKFEPEQSQEASDEGSSGVEQNSSKTDGLGDEKATPFLNSLIDASTNLVRAANQICVDRQKESLDDNEFYQKVSGIRSKSQAAIDVIKNITRKLAPDHVYNDNTNPFEVLFDEIEYGLKRHNKTKYPKLASELDLAFEAELNHSNDSCSDSASQHSCSNDDTSCTFGLDIEAATKNRLKKELLKYEKSLLDSYSIDVDLSKYEFRQRPQDKWKGSFDNFSNRFHNTENRVKYNKIEPQIKFAKESKEVRFFEKNFVPKIYPKFEFLSFFDKEHLVQSHLYSQELNSLVWSEEESDSSHRGYKLLGGDGNLFKVTDNVYNSNPKYQMVVNQKDFDKMIEKIRKYSIVSIDVEHYNVDSFRGFICLIQISTLEDDFIVDPFEMFTYINKLNVVTTDPKILKVMHGAGNDVIWLQRDFGVFIVNLFDTREAAKLLNLNEQSLSNLLRKYFDIKLNKVYQLSDWSKRPLDQDMLNYACFDSHFLIPLYVCLKNEILSKSNPKIRIVQVMKNSRDICLKQYRDRGVELSQKFRSICKRNKIQKGSLDFVSYNFFLNLLTFRNFVARKFDTSENLVIRDYQISILVKSCRSTPFAQLVNTMISFLRNVRYEIANLIKIKNSIELVYKKLNKVELILIRPRSIQFVMNCLNEDNLDKLRSEEFEKLKHTACIDNTLKVYNKFVAGGLFNNISPIQFDMNKLPRAESEVEKSTTEKRSLAEEANIVKDFRKKKINI